MFVRRVAWVAAVCWLAAAALAASSARGAELTEVRSIEGITEYKLDNGMSVLLFPDASKPTVTVNLTIFVGSRHEGYGEAGMAHLLEHMLFKGTPTFPHVPKALTERGADFNGTTWLDRTNYFETLPAGAENLDFALHLEADRMMNSNVKGEDLASEMTVVRNEFERGENMPAYILSQRMMGVAYEWHNYGKSTIGNRADIERVPVDRLRVFYKKYYQPDNAMLVVAGQFEVEQAKDAIVKYFGAIPRPERKLETTYTEEPPQDGERFVSLRRVGDVGMVDVMYHICAGAHPDYPPLAVLEDILTAAPGGKLYKALVETRKATSVEGDALAVHDPGMIEFAAEISRDNDPQVVLGTMLDVIEQVADSGVTKEELERSVRRILKDRELDAADSQQTAIQLSEWAAQGDWRLYFLYRDRVEKVTADDVKRVAGTYFKQNNRTVGIYYPTKKPDLAVVPQTPDLAKMIGDYKGREQSAAGEAFDVTPEKIEARTQRSTLPGGIKAALLPKKTRGEAVFLRVTLRYGDVDRLRDMTSACEFLPHLMKRGTKKLSRQQLEDAIDSQNAQLTVTGEAGQATFSIQTKRENLPEVIGLLKQVLREPSLPAEELEILKRNQIAELEKNLTEPMELARRAVRRTMYPYSKEDPRYLPSLEEEIEAARALTQEKLQSLFADFLNGQHGELTVVGDFDADAVTPLLADLFQDWSPRKPYARIEYPFIEGVAGSTADIRTPGKANAMYFAGQSFPMSDLDEDYPAMVVGNFVLGGGSLSSRLADRVRQQEGLSYGIGSRMQARALDARAAVLIYAICNPNNMPKLKTVIAEELNRFLAEGITADELKAAAKGYLQEQQVGRADDETLVRILEETSFTGRSMRYYTELEERILTLTPEEIHAAFKKHVDPKKLIIVAGGDFPAETAQPSAERAAKK